MYSWLKLAFQPLKPIIRETTHLVNKLLGKWFFFCLRDIKTPPLRGRLCCQRMTVRKYLPANISLARLKFCSLRLSMPCKVGFTYPCSLNAFYGLVRGSITLSACFFSLCLYSARAAIASSLADIAAISCSSVSLAG